MADGEQPAKRERPEMKQPRQYYKSPIADPLLTGKLHTKALKLLKKAHGAKSVRRGVPEITKIVRKAKQKGMVFIAGDIYPVDLIAHLPILCEEKDILYAYVNNRHELGASITSKRPVSICFVQKPHADSPYEDIYNEMVEKLKKEHPYMGDAKMEDVEVKPKKKKKYVD